jgi:hypothetical protein
LLLDTVKGVRERVGNDYPVERGCAMIALMQGPPEALASEDERWLAKGRALWLETTEIAAHSPDVDLSGVYHVLWNLERSPSERLRRGLQHGRYFRAI